MIELEQLSKIYKTRTNKTAPVYALHKINLKIDAGTTVAVIGQNGSGKSTLLSILSGQIDTFEGQAKVNGDNAPTFTRDYPVAFAAEQAIFNPYWTIQDLFNFIGKIQGIQPHTLSSIIQDISEHFQLNDLLKRRFGSLSKGMRQRVNLAQSLITKSDLIVWDEPTSGLDWVFTDLIENRIKSLKAEGKTIVFSSHDLHLCREVCDQLIYLKNGGLQYTGNFIGWNQHLCASQDPLETRLLKQI